MPLALSCKPCIKFRGKDCSAMHHNVKERTRHQQYIHTYKTTQGEDCNAMHDNAKERAKHQRYVDAYRTTHLLKTQHTQRLQMHSTDSTRRTVNRSLQSGLMSHTSNLFVAVWTSTPKKNALAL